MSDPKADYETAVADAFASMSSDMQDIYDQCRDKCQAAWYQYQVRTGMLDVTVVQPATREQDDEQDDTRVGPGDADHAGSAGPEGTDLRTQGSESRAEQGTTGAAGTEAIPTAESEG